MQRIITLTWTYLRTTKVFFFYWWRKQICAFISIFNLNLDTLRKSFFETNTFKANASCSEENVSFYRCLLIHLLFAWKSYLKGQNPCLFKAPRSNLACLFIQTNTVRLKSKSITLISLEKNYNRLHCWRLKETILRAVLPTDTSYSLKSGFLRIYLRLFTSVNKILTKMVLFCTFSVIIANNRVGEHSYIVNVEIQNICSCKSKTTGAEPNIIRKMK